jgi:hypothetical protein
MGLLSNLLNPKHALRSTFDPLGSTITGVTGGKDNLQSMIDPTGRLIKSSSPKTNPATAGNTDVAAPNYGGDPNDPAFGSFTQPFDAAAFNQYKDPGYQWRLQQGQQAVQNRNSAGSGALSGAAFKDLIDYNQGEASTEYGNAFGRYQTQQNNIFSRLSDIAHLGQAGAAGVGAQGTTLAGNSGQLTSNAGAASGAGIVGAGNSLSDGATNAWLWSQLNKKPVSASTNQPVYGNDF